MPCRHSSCFAAAAATTCTKTAALSRGIPHEHERHKTQRLQPLEYSDSSSYQSHLFPTQQDPNNMANVYPKSIQKATFVCEKKIYEKKDPKLNQKSNASLIKVFCVRTRTSAQMLGHEDILMGFACSECCSLKCRL